MFLSGAVAAVVSAIFNFFMDTVSKNLLLCENYDNKKSSPVVDIEELHMTDAAVSHSAPSIAEVPSSRTESTHTHTEKELRRQSEPATSDTDTSMFTCLTKDRHITAAQRAVTAVKTIWNKSNNMIENGFSEKMFVPELFILNSGMIKLALNNLNVDPSVIKNGTDQFFEFMYCIKQQRRKLKDDFQSLKLFDTKWGLDETNGQFRAVGRRTCSANYSLFFTEARVDQLVLTEHRHMTRLSVENHEQVASLCHSLTFDSWAGIHILHVFIADLIGRHNAAAVVFNEKSKQE